MSELLLVSVTGLRLLRLAKFIAVFAFVSGAVGTIVPGPVERRRVFAYRIAGPGFGLTWALGFLLTFLTGQSLLQTYILGALVLSFLTLQGVLFAAGKEGRPGPLGALFVVGTIVATVALMVFRP